MQMKSGQQPATNVDVAERRRSVVVAGFVGDLATAEAGVADPDPEVRAAGFGAMARLGQFEKKMAGRALADPAPGVRRRAAELAGRITGRSSALALVRLVTKRLDDPQPEVAEAAAWALGELAPQVPAADRADAVEALAAMAAEHHDPLCRESAIAALGAIGDPAGLQAVLAGLHDKPAVRRRAAVALAAFDDPAADAGLHRCLDDRDWQVRQVAEVLLDHPPR